VFLKGANRARKNLYARKRGQGPPREEAREEKAFELVLETIDDLYSERGEEDKLGPMVTGPQRRTDSMRYHGFGSFGKLLEEMASRGLLTMDHDQKSGGYIITAVN
jgi:hypothetical protein